MFGTEILDAANGPTLKMRDRLVVGWAEQAKALITTCSVRKGLAIDLTDVSYTDSVGEQVLSWFKSIGAASEAEASYPLASATGLALPLRGESSSWTID
jgi:hypothetical protein